MLILGSQSPRRKEILHFFPIPFEVRLPKFDEESIPFKGDPASYVIELALGKAKSIKADFNDIVITADTTVYFDQNVLNKPKDEKDALRMLSLLSGSTHEVHTGICGIKNDEVFTTSECTKVTFVKASELEIQKYHKAIYSADKAGGYAIQQAGSIIVEKIEGCPYNVMGLPINALQSTLLKLGLSLWDYLKA